MGFSVSASAAIIFISFLVAVSTLYTAWDNSYSSVQAAREDWYSLRESQLHFYPYVAALNLVDRDNDGNNDDVQVVIVYRGTPIDNGIDIVVDGVYRTRLYPAYGGTLVAEYLIPSGVYVWYFIDGADTAGESYQIYQTFANGCTLWFQYQFNGTDVNLLDQGTYCPTEVS